MTDIDLTSAGSSATIGGVIITYGDPIGSGTGIYDPFLAIDDNIGVEEGFNTDATGVLDTDASKTSSLRVADVPVKVIDGVSYLEFRLDLNETNANPLVSLNSMKLYFSSAPAVASDYNAGTQELGAGFTKVFDLDAGGDRTLLLNAHASGSGNDDYIFYVPVSLFSGADITTTYVSLYAEFGRPGTAYGADDGFEEFNTEKTATIAGVKFLDANGNGVRDAGEVGLAGWTIFIDSNNNGVLDAGERSTVTDANGAFAFTGMPLSLGTVRVDEVLKDGWTQTTGDYESVTLSKQQTYNIEIGNQPIPPHIDVVKTAGVRTDVTGNGDSAGDSQIFNFTVTNTGTVNLLNVTLVDDNGTPGTGDDLVITLSGLTDRDGDGQADDLAPGASATGSLSHVFSQAEVDAGTYTNTGTATGVSASGLTATDTDPETVSLARNPALNITKDASVPGGTANVVGELISYTISVQNTGNVTLTGVTVSDPFVSNLAPVLVGGFNSGDLDHDNALDVTETWHYTATHAVTQAELDAGGNITNIATADSDQTGPDTDDASVPVEQNPSLNITKDASVPGGTANAVGELVSYTISVQNTGNVTLTGVTVSDPFVSNLAPVLVGGFNSGDLDHDNALDVTETWHYTANHAVTQAELDAGGNITNIATADSDQTGPDTDDASVPVEQNPSLNITKDASVPGGTANVVGELVSYTISVQNTGNVTLTGVTVSDPFVSNLAPVLVGGFNSGDLDHDNALDVTETWHYTATHAVTQAELDAGGNITNIATADSDQTGPDTDDASVPVEQNPSLNITKDASVPGGTANAVGELVSYTISVQNTGNVTLTGVTVSDPFVSNLAPVLVGGFNSGDLDHDNALDVTETWHYTANHAVTQAELDAGGNITNIATADSDQTGPDTDDASVPVEQNPSLNITKDASVPGGTANVVGELVSYTISVQNTGNVTLTGVTVSDPFVSNLAPVLVGGFNSGDLDHDNALDVTETWHYTANHAVTQAELDAGGNITNIATADSDQTGPDTDDASVPVQQSAAIDIEKYVSIDGGTTWFDADDPMGPIATSSASIAFKFVVTNIGNVTLTNTTVTDSVFDLNGAAPGTAASLGTLAVGASTSFQISAPWTAGQHVNDATAVGNYSGGQASDHDLAYYYGLIDCVGTRTPGFWLSPNGLTFWDGTVGNETKSGPDFPSGELLAFNNTIFDGPDPGTSNKEERYILLGDDNGNGVTDAGEDTLKMSLDLALKVIDASLKPSQDARYVLGRDVIAAWLNFEAGNGQGNASDPNSPAHKMDLAIDWLQQYADANHDGVADFNGAAIKASSAAWQGSGAALHTALDEYNNHGTINGVIYSCSADDPLFHTMLMTYHEDMLA